MVTESVLNRQWRQIDYFAIMSEESYLGRWLRKQLSLRFTQADTVRPYGPIKLTTIIQNSGITSYARLSDNLKALINVLDDMRDIVESYQIEKIYHPDKP